MPNLSKINVHKRQIKNQTTKCKIKFFLLCDTCPCFHTKCHSNVLKFRFIQKKEIAEICVKMMPKLTGWYRDSRKVQIWCSQTCIRPPLLGPLKSGHFRQMVVLQKTFLNFPLTKCGCCWQVFSLFHGTIFVNKELQQRLFWCYSGRIKF